MNDKRIKRIKRSVIEISIALGVIAWGLTLYDHYFLPEYVFRLNIMTSGEIGYGTHGPQYTYNYLSAFSIPGILTMYTCVIRSPLFFQILLPMCFIPQILCYWGLGKLMGWIIAKLVYPNKKNYSNLPFIQNPISKQSESMLSKSLKILFKKVYCIIDSK